MSIRSIYKLVANLMSHPFRYWDQAGVLVQLGLLDPSNLPIAGIEVPRKVLDPFGMPSNTLLKRWHESERLAID